MEKSKRNTLMDNLKGFLMICVVLGHFCEEYSSTHPRLNYIIFLLYLFHMPLFIYISGYFSKKYSFKKNCKLIYQFILFGIIYTLIVNIISNTRVKFEFENAPWTLWYLISLFYWRTIIHFIKTKKIKLVIFISFICAIFVGCFKNIGNYFSLARTIGFFPFFLLGYYSNEKTIEKIKKFNKIAIVAFVLLVLVSTFVIVRTHLIPLMFQWSSRSFNEIGINYTDGIIYKILILLLEICSCIAIINLAPQKKTILSRFGESTITIYGFHASLVYIITHFIKDIPYRGFIYPLIILLTATLVFVLSSSPVKKLYELLMKPYQKISEDGDAKN